MIKNWLIAAAALLLIALLAAWGYFSGYWRFNHPGREAFPIRGIDVSHHQGEIDWEAVARGGFRFAYIKASEGGDFKDPGFQRNWTAAERSGLAVGAYHFFTFCRSGAEQAANFIAAAPADAGALPPAIDFEFVGNCKGRPSKDALLKELSEFADIMRKRYRKEPVLYVTNESFSRYLKGERGGYRLWLRDVFRLPGTSLGREWTIWQYADNARVDGIRGPVDQNAFNGGEKEFLSFRGSAAPKMPTEGHRRGRPMTDRGRPWVSR